MDSASNNVSEGSTQTKSLFSELWPIHCLSVLVSRLFKTRSESLIERSAICASRADSKSPIVTTPTKSRSELSQMVAESISSIII